MAKMTDKHEVDYKAPHPPTYPPQNSEFLIFKKSDSVPQELVYLFNIRRKLLGKNDTRNIQYDVIENAHQKCAAASNRVNLFF